MNTKVDQMTFSESVKIHRMKKFKSAKLFYRNSNLSFNYFYYTKIEKGLVVPSIEICYELINALDMNLRETLISWVKQQLPNEESKSIFDTFKENATENKSYPLDTNNSLTLNRYQLKILLKKEILMEIISFISCCTKSQSSIHEISSAFNINFSSAEKYLNELFESGILDKITSEIYGVKEWVIVPNTKEFDEFRNINFNRSFNQFKKSKDPMKSRNIITIALTEENYNAVKEKFTSFFNWILTISESSHTNENKIYSIGYFHSVKDFGGEIEHK
jgi:predicted transcriptional regulator